MKKVILMISALALLLGNTQCKKQEEPVQSNEKQHVVINASLSNDGPKIAQHGAGLKWSDGDQITVKKGSETLGVLDYQNGTEDIFEGDINTASGNIVFTFGSAINDYMNQHGTLDEVICFASEETAYKADGDYGIVVMKNLPHAVLKLDLSALVDATGDVAITTGDETVAVLKDVTAEASKAVFVAIPANGSPKTYTFNCNGKRVVRDWTLKSGTFYTKNGESGPTGESIPLGKFSVGADKTIVFAPANLYYDGYDGEFRFEANQWSWDSALGEPSQLGTFNWNPNHVSHFKWGDASSAISESLVAEGDLFCKDNFTVTGDSHNDWYTLQKEEWEYLLGLGATTNRPEASNLCGWKVLNDQKGLVILPDGTPSWVLDDIVDTSDLDKYSAIFLPANGIRATTNFCQTPTIILWIDALCYWSSTEMNDDQSWYVLDWPGNGMALQMAPSPKGTNAGPIRLVRNI